MFGHSYFKNVKHIQPAIELSMAQAPELEQKNISKLVNDLPPALWIEIFNRMIYARTSNMSSQDIYEVKAGVDEKDSEDSELKIVTAKAPVFPRNIRKQTDPKFAVPTLSSSFYLAAHMIDVENKHHFQQKYQALYSEIATHSLEIHNLGTDIEMLKFFLESLDAELKTLGCFSKRNWNKKQILLGSASLLFIVGALISISWTIRLSILHNNYLNALDSTYPAYSTISCGDMSRECPKNDPCDESLPNSDLGSHHKILGNLCEFVTKLPDICQRLCSEFKPSQIAYVVSILPSEIGGIFSVAIISAFILSNKNRTRRERLLTVPLGQFSKDLQECAARIFPTEELEPDAPLHTIHQLASERLHLLEDKQVDETDAKKQKKIILSIYAKRLGLFPIKEESDEKFYDEVTLDILDATRNSIVQGETRNSSLSQRLLADESTTETIKQSPCGRMCVII